MIYVLKGNAGFNVCCLFSVSAVYFEQKKYEDCIKQCKEAVEVGRKNNAEYKAIAKLVIILLFI